jgi:hypothetical protein
LATPTRMTPFAEIDRKAPAVPQDERKKTAVISAKVSMEVFEIIDAAALIRAKPRSWIVEQGAILFANQIAQETSKVFAKYRRETRRIHARKAALARHAKKHVQSA